MRPAAFFDRDGVINVDQCYLHRYENLQWIPGAREALALCASRGFLLFVVTNQSGVARGFFPEKDVVALHQAMGNSLAESGAPVTKFYYCPHLPPPDGIVPEYAVACSCRKPLPGMILTAQKEFEIDLTRSFLIGDSPRDIESATAAGIPGYLFPGGNLFDFVRLNVPLLS